MPPVQSLTIALDADLATRLTAACAQTGLSPADLALRALRNDLDGLTAYGRITDEINCVKDALASLTSLVGEALAEPTPDAIGAICRYTPSR